MQFNIKKVLKIISVAYIIRQKPQTFSHCGIMKKEFFAEKCNLKVAKHKKHAILIEMITIGRLAQLARALLSHGRGRGFESPIAHHL